jgi:hypothetical protein
MWSNTSTTFNEEHVNVKVRDESLLRIDIYSGNKGADVFLGQVKYMYCRGGGGRKDVVDTLVFCLNTLCRPISSLCVYLNSVMNLCYIYILNKTGYLHGYRFVTPDFRNHVLQPQA